MLTRRDFMAGGASLLLFKPRTGYTNGVQGRIDVNDLGTTLMHEHILVDFIGADQINPSRWDRAKVIEKMLPYLMEVKKYGVKTLVDCTPAYLGRDVLLFEEIAKLTGLQIITNTGYYGAVQYKYLPPNAFTDTAEQLAAIWIREFEQGIDGTSVKPGFMKISVNGGTLSELERKLVTAAGLTHLATGMTICSHTGPAIAAFEQIELLQKMGIQPDAFVWVHAQAAPLEDHIRAAKMGAWVSLDGIGWGDFVRYAILLEGLKSKRCLHRVIISHDAGWYDPAKENGGDIQGYTNIFTELRPRLLKRGFKKRHLTQLLVTNPAEALAIRVRRV
jgi:phosphotriesterase-related protein